MDNLIAFAEQDVRIRTTAMTAAERAARYRARKRGELPPAALAPCGTLAAYRRHTRHGEPIDDACRTAYNAEQRRMYQARNKHLTRPPAIH